jgi:hypothetical protein
MDGFIHHQKPNYVKSTTSSDIVPGDWNFPENSIGTHCKYNIVHLERTQKLAKIYKFGMLDLL